MSGVVPGAEHVSVTSKSDPYLLTSAGAAGLAQARRIISQMDKMRAARIRSTNPEYDLASQGENADSGNGDGKLTLNALISRNSSTPSVWIPYGALKEEELRADGLRVQREREAYLEEVAAVEALEDPYISNSWLTNDPDRPPVSRTEGRSYRLAALKERRWRKHADALAELHSQKLSLGQSHQAVVSNLSETTRLELQRIDKSIDALLVKLGALETKPISPRHRVSSVLRQEVAKLTQEAQQANENIKKMKNKIEDLKSKQLELEVCKTSPLSSLSHSITLFMISHFMIIILTTFSHFCFYFSLFYFFSWPTRQQN